MSPRQELVGSVIPSAHSGPLSAIEEAAASRVEGLARRSLAACRVSKSKSILLYVHQHLGRSGGILTH